MKAANAACPIRYLLGLVAVIGVATMACAAPQPKKTQAKLPASHPARWLADKFVEWQNPYGRLDPKRCPVASMGPRIISHSFIASALYEAYAATGVEAYKAAADRYFLFYFTWMREPKHVHPAHYGLALAAYGDFREHNPKERLLDARADALFEWLLAFRWDKGSYFRNGYGGGKMVDAGNSDDNCHMGRGLMAHYARTKKPEVLAAAEGLAEYYTTEVKPRTYQGCWSSALGTWVVAPTTQSYFEHFKNVKACEMGWGFTTTGAIDYLTQLAAVTKKKRLKSRIAANCATAMKWQFDACQFEDGACGMSCQDDKWVGMTAGAMLSFLRVRDAGFLTTEEIAQYRPKAQAARDWILDDFESKILKSRGYIRVTGKSSPKLDNLAWLFGWTLDALVRMHEI